MPTSSEVNAEPAPFSGTAIPANEHVLRALQLNKDHQAAVKTQIEQLESKLAALNKLLASAEEHEEDDFEPELGGCISVPGSSAISAPITSKELISEDSPFYADSKRRQRYIDSIGYHPMKTKDFEDLAEAVRTENHRLYALQEQRNGNAALFQKPPEQFLEFNTEGIDWERVASTMSSRNCGRAARECEIKWMGERHPSINRAQWSQPEINRCRELMDAYHLQHGPGVAVDWVWIAGELKSNRTPLDCMRHGTVRKTHVWTPESDNALLEAVRTYGQNNWLLVARVVSPDGTAQQCQNRYQRTLDPTLKRGPWSPAEDAKLQLAVSAYGNSWVDVATMMDGRSNEQCRDRWNERLDPKINKEAWTADEDKSLVDTVGELGEGKWKAVSEKMGNGRKDSACRLRYETLKKGRAKAADDVDEGRSPQPPDGQGGGQSGVSETTRPTPRKRVSAKGNGKKSATPLSGEDPARVSDTPVQPPRKRPRGRPPKIAQTINEAPTTPEDGRSNAERAQRPMPRRRGRPPKAPPIADDPGPTNEQNS